MSANTTSEGFLGIVEFMLKLPFLILNVDSLSYSDTLADCLAFYCSWSACPAMLVSPSILEPLNLAAFAEPLNIELEPLTLPIYLCVYAWS